MELYSEKTLELALGELLVLLQGIFLWGFGFPELNLSDATKQILWEVLPMTANVLRLSWGRIGVSSDAPLLALVCLGSLRTCFCLVFDG